MTLLRRVVRTVRPVVETLLAGILLGVVAMAFATQLSGPGESQTSTEIRVARAYMLAVMRNDVDTMAQLGPNADVLGRAINSQQLTQLLNSVKFDSLTYLGGAGLGPFGVHVYVIQSEGASGMRLSPFALTIVQGKVVQLRGLSPQTETQ
jgi:hypothetical protein